MKLATYVHEGLPSLGVVQGDHIFRLDVPGADMCVVAADWPRYRTLAEQALSGAGIPLDQVTLRPPVTRPGKVMAIGMNYQDHIQEAIDAGHDLVVPDTQTWFPKLNSSLNGPFDPVDIVKVSPDSVDYEAELVVVIGKGGRHISQEDAPDHVFGYCVGNDVSVREWQLNSSQWMLGKSFDTHAPVGPWITTADEIPDPHQLGIRCWINGELRQNSNTREFIFNIWEQIAHASKAVTLMPGDMIFTGTSGGVGFLFSPPRPLRDGDVMRVEVDGLGHIENICRNEI